MLPGSHRFTFPATCCENSEVSPVVLLVAVAVMFCPRLTLFLVAKVNERLPEESVVTLLEKRSFLPSSVPLGLEKNCSMYFLLGVLFTLPLMVVLPALFFAEDRTGLFWRLFGPSSASPGSLGDTPSLERSIPRSPF